MVEVEISPCSGAERDLAIGLLDREFIASRGRSLSFRARFAPLWARVDVELLAARRGGEIVSLALSRPFEWGSDAAAVRAAMIGLVWTRSEQRGKGWGGALLQAAGERLRQQRFEFAVLWTTRPGFYGRAGWRSADCGVLGRFEGGAPAAGDSLPLPRELAPLIERLRIEDGHPRVHRKPACYEQLLPPAESAEAMCIRRNYAIVGKRGDCGYLLDCGGPGDDYPAIWKVLRSRYRVLYLNLQRGSRAQRALAGEATIDWEPQNLACWLPIAPGVDSSMFQSWYIPFFDRV